MTHENLFKHLNIHELNFCRINGENDPEEEAKRYSGKVKSMLPNINNIPQFDLIMLGLGEDGHTASIFPHNIELFNSDQLFAASEHPVSKQIRITATGKIINQAKEICFLVTGPGKAEKVAQVIQKQAGWETLPASLVNPFDGQVIWLLDEPAAAGIR
jgi:6-phosphogluconolactonase